MLKLKQQGQSYAQIATRYGITRQRVFQIVSRSKEKLPNNAQQNPLARALEPQGRGLKRFFVELLGRIRK